MIDRGRRGLRRILALTSLVAVHCTNPSDDHVGIDESFLDKAVDPCVDFYQFACGTWIKEHPVDQYPERRRFDDGTTRNSILLTKILETDRQNMPLVRDRDAILLGKYYDTCLAARASTSVPHTPLDELMQSINRITTLDDLAVATAKLHEARVGALFWLGVGVDPGEPGRAVATLFSSGWGIDRTYFDSDTMSIIPQYSEHIFRTASLYGVPIDPVSVLAVESALAKAALSHEEARDPHSRYQVSPLSAFTAGVPTFPWAKYLAAANFPDVTEVNVTEPAFFAALDELLGTQSIGVIKNYLTWRVLEDYAYALGQKFVTEEAKFHYGVFFGDPKPASDQWACLQSTQGAFGFSLSRAFVSVAFDAAQKDGTLRILSSVKSSFLSELKVTPWADTETRAEAALKLDKLIDNVGYPEEWPENTAISPNYVGSYLDWELTIGRARRAQNLQAIHTGFDRKTWPTAPSVTNAFYDPTKNALTLPAAILQSPHFALEHANALNYGGIGAVAGHELTHAFDDDGRRYDGDGKLRDWFTPAANSEYTKQAQCISEQYSHYEPLPGLPINGPLTLGENIADLGGTKLAYLAYKADFPDESFEGAFDADQQFFLSMAQLSCAHVRDERVAALLRYDPHSPDKFRVNGVVANLPEFEKAFHCPAGSPMAPTNRCVVW